MSLFHALILSMILFDLGIQIFESTTQAICKQKTKESMDHNLEAMPQAQGSNLQYDHLRLWEEH